MTFSRLCHIVSLGKQILGTTFKELQSTDRNRGDATICRKVERHDAPKMMDQRAFTEQENDL